MLLERRFRFWGAVGDRAITDWTHGPLESWVRARAAFRRSDHIDRADAG